MPSLYDSNYGRKTLFWCSLITIIILSGCVEDYPKTEFKKTFSRVADSDEELVVIDFIETFDFPEFTGPEGAERQTEDFYIYDSDLFIGNILSILDYAEGYYENRPEFKEGDLFYHIALANVSYSEREEIISIAKEIFQGVDVSSTDLDSLRFGAFKMSEGNRSIFDEEIPIPQDFYTLMNLTEWFWVCVIDLEYTITARFQQEWYGIAEIIIITPSLEVLGLMSVCLIGGWVA